MSGHLSHAEVRQSRRWARAGGGPGPMKPKAGIRAGLACSGELPENSLIQLTFT